MGLEVDHPVEEDFAVDDLGDCGIDESDPGMCITAVVKLVELVDFGRVRDEVAMGISDDSASGEGIDMVEVSVPFDESDRPVAGELLGEQLDGVEASIGAADDQDGGSRGVHGWMVYGVVWWGFT